jgi:hypothetical protein
MIKTVGLYQAGHSESFDRRRLPAANISQQADEGLELLREWLPASRDHSRRRNVQTVGEARNAIEAGARFFFSPSFDPALIELCHQQGVAIYPVTTDGILAVEQEMKGSASTR